MKRLMWFMLLSLFVCVLIGCCGCGGPAVEADPLPNVEEPVEELEVSPDIAMSIALQVLEKNFAEIAEVKLDRDERTFYLLPIDPSFLMIVELKDDPECVEAWNDMVESLRSMGETFSESIPGCSVVLQNPMNPDKGLLIIVDGVVIYDCFREE